MWLSIEFHRDMTTPLITAIICTRNRAQLLEPAIQSLLRQTRPRVDYEIMVVDNGSTDQTAEVCKRLADNSVRYVFEPVPGLSKARNTGWRQSQSRYTAYLDDDAIADETWIDALICAYEYHSPVPAAVGGPVRLKWEVPEPAWINHALRLPLGFLDWGRQPRRLTPAEFLIGANCSYCRVLLEQFGGFDEHLGRKINCLLSGEETQIQRKIEQTGGYLFYTPAAGVQHFVPAARTQPWWFYNRFFWGGVSDVLISRTVQAVSASIKQVAVTGPQKGGAVPRLLFNLIAAMGLAPTHARRIQSRIYMAYVLGWLWAKFGKVNADIH
jgi:glycosyltransferase involved in cell wall biosynthesis